MLSSLTASSAYPFNCWHAPKREAASGVARLKWDAKVRMKQAKLRAAGEIMDRQQVVEVIVGESVEAAQAGVRDRFDEIARERGFHEGDTGEGNTQQGDSWEK